MRPRDPHPLRREPVNARRLAWDVPVTRQRRRRQILGDDEQDVGFP